MTFKHSIGSSLRESGGKQKEPQPKRAYSRFFEGYTEYESVDRNGKTKVDWVYTGNYYAAELSEARRIKIKLIYALAFCAISAVLICLAVFSDVKYPKYMELLQAAAVFFLGWMLIGLVFYLPAPQKMTAYTYKSATNHLRRSTACLTVCFVLLLIGSLIYMVFAQNFALFDLLGYVLGGGFAFLVYRVEKGIRYRTENKAESKISE